ncbi:MAG: hypothetical protein ABA06_02440 [Parcubacteria bacterium C7867-001]|nr:MAG: hypothetical protein ABA06_02440 [Parcubacteria bacterium C7867-001]
MTEESTPPKVDLPPSTFDSWKQGKSPRQDFDRMMFEARHPVRDPDAPIEPSEFARKAQEQ